MRRTLTALILFTQLTQAEEGFSYNPPAALQNAWNNSVMIAGKANDHGGRGFGSGIILQQEKIGEKFYIYILTAGHLDRSLGWPALKEITPAEGLFVPDIFTEVRAPVRAVYLPGQRGARSHETISPWATASLPVKSRFVWGFLSQAEGMSVADAGLMVFESEQALPNFTPTPVADPNETQAGDRVYEIGFPAVMLRPDSAQRVKIQDPELVTKRISQGQFSGPISPRTEQELEVMAATTDTSKGGSGGAILNKYGKIIGIASFMNSFPDDDWAYMSGPMPWHVAFVGTESLKEFVTTAIEKFKISRTRPTP